MSVEVVNKSRMGGKTHIGSGSIALTAALEEAEKPSDFIISLIHRQSGNNIEKGYVSMEGKLNKIEEKKESKVNEPEKQPNQIPSTQSAPAINNEQGTKQVASKPLSVQPGNYLLSLSKLKVSDLFNTGSALDRQDPAVYLTVGKKEFHTERYRNYIFL
jgi:hypothetical protein